MTRMAGQVLIPLAPSAEVERLVGETNDAKWDKVKASDFLTEAKESWERSAAIPGNSWILPDQYTQHRTGNESDLDWQYPFFRQDLADAGLLPREAPPGTPAEIRLPVGVSVLEAIETGLIR